MEFSSYQAAALYDSKRGGRALPYTALVVDADRCTCGFCRCEADGRVTLLRALGTPLDPPGDHVFLRGIAPSIHRDEAVAPFFLDEQAQRALWNYYASGGVDGEKGIYTLPHLGPVTCAEADAAFGPIRDALRPLLEEALRAAEELGAAEEDLRIVAVGNLAATAPAQLALREALCFDPFLPDDRFAALGAEEAAGAVEQGQRLYRAGQVFGFDLDLLYLTREGEFAEPLARCDQPAAAPEEARFVPAVFLSGRQALRLRCNGETLEFALPFAAAAAGECVSVACAARERKPLPRRQRGGGGDAAELGGPRDLPKKTTV